MLFWLTLLIFAIGIGLIVWQNLEYECGVIWGTGLTLAMLSGIALGVMLFFIPFNHIGLDAKVEQYKETYEAITYKVESGVCRDEFGLLNKEVVDEIQSWNTDLRYKQNIQDNFWVGIFYPNIYDQFEYIDYSNYKRE